MTYAAGQDIAEDEYNIFATGGADGTPNHTVDNINTIWGVGTGDKGYGQTDVLTAVSTGGDVTATQWATMLDRMDSMEAHQGSVITNPTNPTVGVDIAIFSALSGDITTLFDSRLDSVANGVDTNNTISASSTWTDNTTQEVRISWSSANHARYWFNAGGEFQFAFSRSGGTSHTKNTEWTNLCTACSTLVMHANTFAKSGGSGSPSTLTNNGWYDLTASYVLQFQQFEDTGPYTANYITVESRTAASGAQLEVRVIYKDDAADTDSNDTVDGTVTSTFIERPPSLAQLSNSWGNPSASTLTNSQT